MTKTVFKSVIMAGTALGLLGLAGCASSGDKRTVPVSYLEGTPLDRHDIGVKERTEFLEIKLNAYDTQLSSQDTRRIKRFLSAYTDHGHGPLIMSMPANSQNPQFAVNATKAARAMAWEHGVEYDEIAGRTHDAKSGDTMAPLILAFQAYEAVAPDCVSLATIDFSNATSNNELPSFGCAIRKNQAAMIADPADLLGSRELDPGDLLRRQVILERFREGAQSHADRSSDERAGISDAVN